MFIIYNISCVHLPLAHLKSAALRKQQAKNSYVLAYLLKKLPDIINPVISWPVGGLHFVYLVTLQEHFIPFIKNSGAVSFSMR